MTELKSLNLMQRRDKVSLLVLQMRCLCPPVGGHFCKFVFTLSHLSLSSLKASNLQAHGAVPGPVEVNEHHTLPLP